MNCPQKFLELYVPWTFHPLDPPYWTYSQNHHIQLHIREASYYMYTSPTVATAASVLHCWKGNTGPQVLAMQPSPQPLARQPSSLTVDKANLVPKKTHSENLSTTVARQPSAPTVGKATLGPNCWQDNPWPQLLARQPSAPTVGKATLGPNC
jgi:hypothetical protein